MQILTKRYEIRKRYTEIEREGERETRKLEGNSGMLKELGQDRLREESLGES